MRRTLDAEVWAWWALSYRGCRDRGEPHEHRKAATAKRSRRIGKDGAQLLRAALRSCSYRGMLNPAGEGWRRAARPPGPLTKGKGSTLRQVLLGPTLFDAFPTSVHLGDDWIVSGRDRA